jgi:hypothetical protein
MSKKQTWGVYVGFLSVLVLVMVGLIAGNAFAVKGMASSSEKKNMKLIGYSDLQGRESLQVTLKGDWAFVGHHPRAWATGRFIPRRVNPLTGNPEENGTTILDVSDPKKPIIVAHIKNDSRVNSRSASVVYNFMDSGHDYLIRNHETEANQGGFPPIPRVWKWEIFDITVRANPVKVGEITGTPVYANPTPLPTRCGGILTRAHKGWWSQNGLFYGTVTEPCFNSGGHLAVWDLSNLPNETPIHNFNADFVGRGWLPGQKVNNGPNPSPNLNMHHPVVDELSAFGPRVYGNYLTGGNVVSFDVSTVVGADKQFPVAWTTDLANDDAPNARGRAHTGAVIRYDDVPNIEDLEGAEPRYYYLQSDEAGGGDMKPPTEPIRTIVYMFDVTDAEDIGNGSVIVVPLDTWQVPTGDYLLKGGRFGPHQFAETVDGEYNLFEDRIAYVAYFNAGVRVLDISNPLDLKEVGYYVPQANERTGLMRDDQPAVIQINDVDVDYRGLVYASDRVGSGLFVLEFKK